MQQNAHRKNGEAGFSLMELLVAMMVMMFITGAATSLLVGAFNVRAREDNRSEALSDARRALNIMSREIANSGYQLPDGLTYTSGGGSLPVPSNGLIPTDCDGQSMTFVTNLDANIGGGNKDVNGADEAIKYQFFQEGASSFLVRKALNPGGGSLVLANRIDGLQFQYFNNVGVDTSADLTQATSVRITVWVTLNQIGTPGSTSYQAPSQVTLSSDVELRNANLGTF